LIAIAGDGDDQRTGVGPSQVLEEIGDIPDKLTLLPDRAGKAGKTARYAKIPEDWRSVGDRGKSLIATIQANSRCDQWADLRAAANLRVIN
jgi:hypothetical protein